MHIENIKKVRDRLADLRKEDKEIQFDMSHIVEYFDFANFSLDESYVRPVVAMREGSCKTSACICGWAVVMLADPQQLDEGDSLWNVGKRLFGLSENQAQELFAPWDSLYCEEKYGDRVWEVQAATPEQAVKVLDHLIETGDVDWNKAFDDEH